MKKFLLPLALVLAVAGNVAHFRFTRDTTTAPLLDRIATLERALEDQTLDQSRIHSELATHRAWIRKLTAPREEAPPAIPAAPPSAAAAPYQPGLEELDAEAERLDRKILNLELSESNRLLRELGQR